VLQAGVLSVIAVFSIVYGFFGALAWWLFWIFLALVCALKKNTNVPPNALANVGLNFF
jgi:hypothetical protein